MDSKIKSAIKAERVEPLQEELKRKAIIAFNANPYSKGLPEAYKTMFINGFSNGYMVATKDYL